MKMLLTKYAAAIADAQGLAPIEQLAAPSFFNRLERRLVGGPPVSPQEDPAVLVAREKARIAKQLQVTPHLSGSLASKLNLPGDVDIDFFVRAQSPKKFQKLVTQLSTNPEYAASPYNVEGAGYHVFQRRAAGEGDLPVDVAVAYGAPAKEYLKTMKAQQRTAQSLPEPLRQQLIEKKHILRNTPFDFRKMRYKAWKRDLDAALGGGYRLTRDPVPELTKQSEIVDFSDPEQAAKFERFVNLPDVYGHRTHDINSLVQSQKLISGLEALRRGKLKNYEAGDWAGRRKEIAASALDKEQLKRIENAMFTAAPETKIFDEVAKDTGRDAAGVKVDFLRQRYGSIKNFLAQQENPEEMRLKHFAVPKLGPNIFVTKGGVLDSPTYGDSAVLLRSRTAKRSPFFNMLTDEYIIPPKDVLAPRQARIGSGYVLTPREKIEALHQERPNLKFVAMEDLPEHLRGQVLKPLRSLSEIPNRILPAALSGELSIRQTR